jgi:hypothetical protein
MVEHFPKYDTGIGSHPYDCDMKGCKNKRRFEERLCQECLYKEKFSKLFADINELQDTIQKKEEELSKSDTHENHEKINKDIVRLKEILEIFKQKISYPSDTVSDNRKIYKGTNQDGQQLILETHCTIVRVSNSPENVYFGHVTLDIIYPDDTKYKWHYGIKTSDQLPKNLNHEYWQTVFTGQTYHDAGKTKVSKIGNFPSISAYTTLLIMMKHHFIKCFDYFTQKSQWDKQIWYKRDVVGDEDADTVFDRLKQENDKRQPVDFAYYEGIWSKIKKTEQTKKDQERKRQERELRELERRDQQEREQELREQRELQELQELRERREREQLGKPMTQQHMDHIQHQRTLEDEKSQEYRIEEQTRKEIAEHLAQENLEAENAKRRNKALKEEEKKNEKLRVLRQRAYDYRQKQNKLNEDKYEEDRIEQQDSEYFKKYLEEQEARKKQEAKQIEKEQQIDTYLKEVETKERKVLEIEEKLKEVDLMSSKAISIRQFLSKRYKKTIENFNKIIVIAENDKDLNTETKSTFLNILKEKLEVTEKRVHLLNQKELAYVLNIRIQKIEDHYKNVIAPTEKKLQTLKYEEGSIWRRFLINYYRTTYEDRDSEYKSIISKTRRDVSDEEYINIVDKLIKLDSLIKSRERLEELCKLETPLIIDYYKLYDDDGNEDDDFIISQLFILHPSFFTEGMAKVFVERARKENNGILSTKYFIKFFPENARSYNKALAIFREMMLKNLNKTK